MNTLAEITTSKVRAEILRLLFGIKQQEQHVREIERQSGFALPTVRCDHFLTMVLESPKLYIIGSEHELG